MNIRWITPLLGTAPASALGEIPEIHIVDVRDMVDKAGNRAEAIREKIRCGCALLTEGRKTVVCCDNGISRSNAIAAGILAGFEHIPFNDAVRRVLETTGETEINLDVINATRNAIETEVLIADGRERWLLTGGHGYLGSIFASSIPKDIELLRPFRKELDLLRGGVALDLYVREHRVTRILHFAAPHVMNTNSSVGESVIILRNVLDTCISNHIPLFLPSRWEVFGGYKGQTMSVDEQTPLRPAGVTGDSKFLSEKLIEVFTERACLEATVLRSGLVFGNNGAPNFMLGFIRRAMCRESITTHIYINGPPKLDLLPAGDWLQACWKLLLSGKTGVFHLGSGKLLSTVKVAEIIFESCGMKAKPDSILMDDSTANIMLDSRKITSLLDWRPSGNIESKIADLVSSLANASSFSIGDGHDLL